MIHIGYSPKLDLTIYPTHIITPLFPFTASLAPQLKGMYALARLIRSVSTVSPSWCWMFMTTFIRAWVIHLTRT